MDVGPRQNPAYRVKKSHVHIWTPWEMRTGVICTWVCRCGGIRRVRQMVTQRASKVRVSFVGSGSIPLPSSTEG